MQGVNTPHLPPQVTVNNNRNGKPRRYPHSLWWYLKWFVIVLQLIVFCAIVITVTAGYGIYQELSKIMPDVSFVSARNKGEATRIYASDGALLGEIKGERRKWVSIEELKTTRKWGNQNVRVPGRLMDATLSIEDARFYSHPGMDPKRIAGAALANFRSRDSTSQGGSTITEQLAVNIYLTRTKTLSRRLQTALLALQLERRFSKDEILELYLNEIYYGNRAYGCEAAAQIYFNKSAKDLSIPQAALIAGLPQSPSRLDPFENYKNAKRRQLIVLKEMFDNKKINYQQWQDARKDTTIERDLARAQQKFLEDRRKTQKWRSPYFVSYVKQYLQKEYGWSDEFLNKSGLKIYTTLDPKLQEIAEEVMRKRVNRYSTRRSGNLEGALVCIDPQTGHVLAMVGGRDYYNTKSGGQWNRAVQGKRQPGSTFKPYIYATALEAGYSPNNIVIDKPYEIWNHKIRNFTRRHAGAMTFREALATSNNVAATRVLMKVGIANVIQKAHLMGITSSLVPVPTLALGTSEISLLEHTSAFGVFATGGLRAEETPVRRVDDYSGRTLVEQQVPVHGARVLSEEAAKGMWSMLRSVVTSRNGTGSNASIRGYEVVGKTGTTSSNKDVWFMGATKQLVCGIWMGYDRPRELYGATAGAWCAPAWRSFMVQALDVWRKKDRVSAMIEDARATDQRRLLASQYKKVVSLRVCNESGLLANSTCPSTRQIEISSAEGVPTQRCNIPAHQPKNQAARPLGTTLGEDETLGISGEGTARGDFSLPADDSSSSGLSVSEEPVPSGGDDDSERATDTATDSTAPPTTNSDGLARRSDLESRQGRPPRQTPPPSDEPRILNADPSDNISEAGTEVPLSVCADSGDLATPNCPVTAQRFFASSEAPSRSCRLHRR
jgi:penicillin-binding protein 1A